MNPRSDKLRIGTDARQCQADVRVGPIWSVPHTSSQPTAALRDFSCLTKQRRSLWRPLRASAGSTRPSPLSRSLWQHSDQQSLRPVLARGFGRLTILRAEDKGACCLASY